MSGARGTQVSWQPRMVVEKWDLDQIQFVKGVLGFLDGREPCAADFRRAGVDPTEIVEAEGNLLTGLGAARMASLLIGGGSQAMTVAATRIGVGNSTTTPATAADTDLFAAAGSANRWFSPVDSISATDNVITLVATFGTTVANFTWQEYGIDIGAPTVAASAVVNTLFNHKVGVGGTLGTKTSTYAWAFTTHATIG